jgi:GTPase
MNTNPFRCGAVALVGRPNAGKSTLLNALLDEKLAIVSPRPQTTRSVMAGILTQSDSQIVFYDTPGMHQPRNELSHFMMRGIQGALDGSDMAFFLVDAVAGIGAEEEIASDWLKKAGLPVHLLINKTDAVPYPRLLTLEAQARELGPWPQFKIQALNGLGLEEVLAATREQLPVAAALFPADQLTDRNLRDMAAELIREQCFLQLKQEVPYGTAVVVEEYEEKKEPLVITATIYVEKDAHKGIVIGAGGAQLKALGQAARESIERLTGLKVFLQLWVKVAKNWRKDPTRLKRMGYESR